MKVDQGVMCSTGLVRQAANGRKYPDLALIPTCVKLPVWLKQWADRQPETLAVLIVQAFDGYYGAMPDGVRRVLQGLDEQEIARKAAILGKTATKWESM